jgi:hypothetical protein
MFQSYTDFLPHEPADRKISIGSLNFLPMHAFRKKKGYSQDKCWWSL